MNSLISQVTVAAGSASSETVGVLCSRLMLVGDSVIPVSVPCSSIQTTAPVIKGPSSTTPITGPALENASTVQAPASVSTVFHTNYHGHVRGASIIATCLGGTPTSMLTCPSLPACPSCSTGLPCLSDDSGSSSGSTSGSETNPEEANNAGRLSSNGSGGVSGSRGLLGYGDNSGVTSLSSYGPGSGPCPGQGYLCDDCINGWFCPPPLTPALPAPLATSGNAPVGGAVVEITITSTQPLTVFETAAAAETIHPATAGWQYGGCYKDDTARALQNESITAMVVGGMTTEICIIYCKTLGYRLAGTEAGYMCFCGDEVVDFWRIAESDCGIPCEGEPEFICSGNLALSIWSITGHVPKAPGPEMNFSLPTSSPADEDDLNEDDISTEEEVPTVAIVTDVALKNMQMKPTAIDVEDMASSVSTIVSAAMDKIQRMAASEVAKSSNPAVSSDRDSQRRSATTAIVYQLIFSIVYNIPTIFDRGTISLAISPMGVRWFCPFYAAKPHVNGHSTRNHYDNTRNNSDSAFNCGKPYLRGRGEITGRGMEFGEGC
ncbi:hypothetical protein B0T13DRAFT_448861 [Neurospora crassa]|nr:hypothetical protein B0T13DRAFT_448861 [Neurospora crassa]